MFRKVAAVIGVITVTALLAGCATQAEIDAANAKWDNGFCADLGITREDARYAECRIVAAQIRMNQAAAEAQRNAALSQSLLGAGALFNSMNPPPQTLIVR